MAERDDGMLRDSEVALMDSIKLLLEILIAKGISKPEVLERAFAHQGSQYPPADMPRAIFVTQCLREFLRDSTAQAPRGQMRSLAEKPPAGSA
jgi:hypothetical protein